MIPRLLRALDVRHRLRRHGTAEAGRLLLKMPPDHAWQAARTRGDAEPANRKLWALVRQEIARQSGYQGPSDTATRYLDR